MINTRTFMMIYKILYILNLQKQEEAELRPDVD
jgi:hypothetical protein